MTRIVRLQPHDALPTGRGDYITVIHRFKDDAPDETVTEITVTTRGSGAQSAVAEDHGAHALGLDKALERARVLAEHNGVPEIFVVDRTGGPVEQAVQAHHGDRGMEEVGPDYDEAADAGRESSADYHSDGLDVTRPQGQT
jgi:hypothetical protein